VIERETVIVNPLGMHARPAAQVVRLTAGFGANVELECDGQTVNGKSIMGVMMLAAECGAKVRVRTDGADEEAAMDALLALIANGFGER
jgi:phosphocarrier protein HPr